MESQSAIIFFYELLLTPKRLVVDVDNTDKSTCASPTRLMMSPPPQVPESPLISRKMNRIDYNNSADKIIKNHKDLLASFPPLPTSVLEKNYTDIGNDLVKSRSSPPVPRKPIMDPKISLEMKKRAQQNSTEVHRLKSPMHASLESINTTPVFSDAPESHLDQSYLSDAKSSDIDEGLDTEIESVKVLDESLQDEDLDSLAAISIYQESEVANEGPSLGCCNIVAFI